MDVTFFENQSYYPKFDIQGENSIHEYQFWETENFSSHQPVSPSPTPILPSHHVPVPQVNEPLNILSDSPKTPYRSILIQLAKNSEFIVFSKKKKKTRGNRGTNTVQASPRI